MLEVPDPALVVPIHPCKEHSIARLDLVQAFPEEQGHADHVHETEQRMVVRPGELVTLSGANSERRVLTRVEERRCAHRTAEPIEHLEVDRVVGLRLGVGNDIADS